MLRPESDPGYDPLESEINEDRRLASLYDLEILDTEKEQVFDQVTQSVAQFFDAPISLISLVDRERQWFKSHHGLDICETGLDLSFCKHLLVMDQEDVLLVPDATQDPRFCDNAIVTGGIKIRFYAGAPIVLTDGEIMGSLCVIDNKPRDDFTREHETFLKNMAGIATKLISTRLANKQLDLANQSLGEMKKKTDFMLKALDCSPSAITVSDMRKPDHPMIYVNQGFVDMTGYEKQNVVGRNCRFLQGPDTDPEDVDRIRKAISTEQDIKLDLLNYRQDGTPFWNLLRLAPVFGEDGELTSYIGVQNDVTERRKEQQEKLQYARLASLGELAGGMAHEINNALQPLLGLAEIIKDKIEPLDREAYQYMELVEENALHARGIVADVLAFARQEESELETYIAEHLIDAVTDFARDILPSSVGVNKLNYGDECIEGNDLGNLQIRANKNGLMQIMNNLFKNAAHAMDHKGEINVSVATFVCDKGGACSQTMPAGTYVRLDIVDHGAGMDEATQQAMFDPFFTKKEHGEGTGLGMSTVHGILKSWNGHIAVQSKPGAGTRISLYFPTGDEKQVEKEEGDDV